MLRTMEKLLISFYLDEVKHEVLISPEPHSVLFQNELSS